VKVAIVINTSWNIYNFRKGIVQALLDRGDEVVAIAPHDEYSDELKKWGCEYIPIEMTGTGMNPFKDFLLMIKIRQAMKRAKVDAVLTYTIKPNLYGSIAAGTLGIPCICNVSGLGTTFLWTGMVRNLAIQLYNFAFRFNKWVFFQNEEDQIEFLSLIKLNPKKTSLLPGSGINTSQFVVTPVPSGDKIVFMMIARLIIEKGVRDYIEAIRILKLTNKNLEFHLIGSLDETHARSIKKEELESWINEGLIIYTDHLSDVRPAIANAHVIVLPSYREGTPRTLLEGGAMGKVLLATDVPGCRQVVLNGVNGFLFKLKNPKDLAAKMKLYLSLSNSEREEMSRKSRERIETVYDESRVVELYLQKLNELVSDMNA
jgi:glycosyltransferase involved in cell wall biosynthesis